MSAGDGVIERALDGEEVAVGRRVIVGALVGFGVTGGVVAVFDGNNAGECVGVSVGRSEVVRRVGEVVGEAVGKWVGVSVGRCVGCATGEGVVPHNESCVVRRTESCMYA